MRSVPRIVFAAMSLSAFSSFLAQQQKGTQGTNENQFCAL
jgi:hypothetical protein